MEDHFDTGDHYMNHVLTVDGSGERVLIAGLPHDFQFRGNPHVTLVAHPVTAIAADGVRNGRKHPVPFPYVCCIAGAREWWRSVGVDSAFRRLVKGRER